MSTVPLAFDLTFYSLIVSLHVIFAVIGLGSAFAFPFIGALAQKNPQHTVFALEVNFTIIKKWISPMAVLILITGLYQVFDGPYSFGDDHWLDISFALFIVYMGIIGAITTPGTRRALELARESAGGPPPQEMIALIQRNAKLGPLLGGIIILTTFLMEAKPF
ncbi:MAG: DUF2269 family protein [Solirubrobacterales bacterium]